MHSNQNPEKVSWRRLLPGLAFIAAIIVAMISVLAFAEIGGVSGSTIRIYAAFEEAREIMPNTEVWLHGERVGVVRSVEFQPPSVKPEHRVLVTLDVLERARPFIRQDAIIQVRVGESFLGSPVLYVSGGSASAPSVLAGDTLGTTIRLDQDQMASDIRRGFTDARMVISNIQKTAGAIRDARGSIAALIGNDDGAELSELQVAMGSLSTLMTRTEALRNFTGDTALRGRILRLASYADSMVTVSDSGSLRRALGDTASRKAAAELSAELASVRQAVRERLLMTGRLPDAEADAAVPGDESAFSREELERLDSALGLLMSDLKRRPWRYVGF